MNVIIQKKMYNYKMFFNGKTIITALYLCFNA